MKTIEIELAIANYFNYRQNIVVPNVFWGMGFRHECDIFVLTKAGYGYEVEIKTNKQDLIRDSKKKLNHKSSRIKYLYFAIPEELEKNIDLIPEYAGLLVVAKKLYKNRLYYKTKQIRKPRPKSNYKFTDEERNTLLNLAYMRIWALRKKLIKHETNI